MLRKYLADHALVPHIAHEEFSPAHEFPVTAREVVQQYTRYAGVLQELDNM
jgi:hypothetical protein